MAFWDEVKDQEPGNGEKARGSGWRGGRDGASGHWRIRGISKDKTTCERCGRSGLEKTIVVEYLDDEGKGTGEVYFLGSECASIVTGSSSQKINAQAIEKSYREGMERKRAKYSHLSDAQREAGNYKMKKLRMHGLNISIETCKGERRKPEWPPIAADYGYIKGSRGKDGDHVDVFIGPDRLSEMVYVIDQVDQNGKFDEHKCMLGFRTREKAIAAYRASYTSDWKVGKVTPMTIGQFKAWLDDGSQNKPIERQVSRYAAE